MFDEQPFSLTPVNFFALAFDCHYLAKKDSAPSFTKCLLPNTTNLCHEYSFAKVAMGWHEDGLAFHLQIDQPFIKSTFPDVTRGDSIELMIDTRDLKSAGFNTRFCHHFYFLPKPVDEHHYGEITRFRTEDRHDLCDSHLLQFEPQFGKDGYKVKIFIPSQCLYGYDPKQFDRLGFTYRINRTGGKPQHFSVISQEYQIDQQPSLWSSLRLIK
ncbi:MAG: hypothetical protein H0W88_05525 [Parachlamydiaceae bacterium]|nr:hypothetical protein [Parachlamydiaceae bacterium]